MQILVVCESLHDPQEVPIRVIIINPARPITIKRLVQCVISVGNDFRSYTSG